MNAIDLNKGEIKWQVPFGEFKELKEKGIPATGAENYGGPVATGGGLVFIAASRDKKSGHLIRKRAKFFGNMSCQQLDMQRHRYTKRMGNNLW